MKTMRRKDREIADRKAIDQILARSEVLFLAMADGNRPYVVPLSFGYDGTHIYFHCAKEGLKLDFIKNNPSVCFTCVEYVTYEPVMTSCDAGTKFQSVIGRGTAELIYDFEEKKKALDVLVDHYAKIKPEFPEAVIKNTAIVKITITELKGKRR